MREAPPPPPSAHAWGRPAGGGREPPAAHACALRAPSMAAALRYPRALTACTDRGDASRAASVTLRGTDSAGGGGRPRCPSVSTGERRSVTGSRRRR